MARLPMFPLGMVLLPGGVLPLHVFEPRYRQMIIDILERDGTPEFGQTLITHGHEAGGGDERAMVGTVAQIVQCEALDATRYAMVTVGTRRIVVNEWLPDDPYPIADVADWPDAPVPDEASAAADVDAIHARVRHVIDLAGQLGDFDAESVDTEIAGDPTAASYHLAALAPIGPADRYRLLSADGPVARLAALGEVLDDVEAAFQFRLGAAPDDRDP